MQMRVDAGNVAGFRSKASYDLSSLALFASNAAAKDAVRVAENALALLDAIEANPARLAAAIATFPP